MTSRASEVGPFNEKLFFFEPRRPLINHHINEETVPMTSSSTKQFVHEPSSSSTSSHELMTSYNLEIIHHRGVTMERNRDRIDDEVTLSSTSYCCAEFNKTAFHIETGVSSQLPHDDYSTTYGSVVDSWSNDVINTTSAESAEIFSLSGLMVFCHRYQAVHGYMSIVVCLFGIVANMMNIIVLTRRTMVSMTSLQRQLLVSNVFDKIRSICPTILHPGSQSRVQSNYVPKTFILMKLNSFFVDDLLSYLTATKLYQGFGNSVNIRLPLLAIATCSKCSTNKFLNYSL